MRTLYTIVYTIGFILAAPYWLIRGLFNHQYLKTLKKRFIGPGRLLPHLDNKPRIWVWAMSLGEVLSARELVRELEKDGCEVIITATTQAGLTMAKTNWPTHLVLPSPLDFPLSVRRFLNLTQPDQLILVETDLWPGILWEMKKRSLSAVLVSARLSPRSFKNYYRIRFFWGRVLRLFDRIVVQTQEDLTKFLALGAKATSVAVGGNLKFDQSPPAEGPMEAKEILDQTGWPQGRYLVAGSFHTGEDVMILTILRQLLPDFPELKLILAPRDRHKFSMTYKLAQDIFPHKTARRSHPEAADKDSQVFILDTLGELEKFYALAEVALIGKSWPGHHEGGGHNPLEAAVRGRPVISGPKVHNFKWIYKALCEAKGAVLVEKKDLPAALASFLRDEALLKRMGQNGQQFVSHHRGAVRRTLDLVKRT
jgi:3-deoxy-D-manno-octulosonic-acid transferase